MTTAKTVLMSWQDLVEDPYKAQLEFHVGHVMKLLGGITRKTVYNWLRWGWIEGTQEEIGRRSWRFSLVEINRLRAMKGMPELSVEQATKFWEEWDGQD